jgi:hypothetical protein
MGLSYLYFAVNGIQNSFILHFNLYYPIVKTGLYKVWFFIKLENVQAMIFNQLYVLYLHFPIFFGKHINDIDSTITIYPSDIIYSSLIIHISAYKQSFSCFFLCVRGIRFLINVFNKKCDFILFSIFIFECDNLFAIKLFIVENLSLVVR